MRKLKELSTTDYNIDRLPSIADIQCSALIRIADATEAMAKNYQQLIRDAALYKEWYTNATREKVSLQRRLSALQGVITKQRKKIATLKAN